MVQRIYSLWERLYKLSAIFDNNYCTLLGVILHVAKADIALLIETMYIVRLTINSTVESAIWD